MRAGKAICLLLIVAASGCTSVQVKPIDPAAQMLHVCIRDNPKVTIDDFVPVLREGFDRHAISTEVFSGERPARCEYILTYTARRSWDMATYLSQASLQIDKAGRIVASAEYRLRGKGGLSLTKWQGTKAKMDPVIDELIRGKSTGTKTVAR